MLQLVDYDTVDSRCNGVFMDNGLLSSRSEHHVHGGQLPLFSATDGTRNLSGCQVSIPQGGVVDYTDASTDNEQARMSAVAQQPVSIAIVVLFWYVHRFMRYAS